MTVVERLGHFRAQMRPGETTPLASSTPLGETRASRRLPCLLGLCALSAAWAALTGRRAAAPRVATAAAAAFSSPEASSSAYSYSFGDVEQAWDWISEIEASTAVVCPTADFALCDVAMCTLNADRLTASCGCQRMAASEHNPASVGITEAGVLAFSSSYRDLLEQCAASATCDVQADAEADGGFCDSLASGALYPASMGVDLVSFYAINPLYAAMDGAANQSLSDHIGGFRCNGTTMLAACQGAPCYDVSYDAPVFDLQCVCPVTATTTDLLDLESGADGAACTTINADDEHRACAFSATADPLTMYPDAEVLADVIAAVEAAATAGDAERCPSIGTKFPYYSGERDSLDDDQPYDVHWGSG